MLFGNLEAMTDKCATESDKDFKEQLIKELIKSTFVNSDTYMKRAPSARTLSYKERKQIRQNANMMANAYRKRRAGDTEASLVASLLFS